MSSADQQTTEVLSAHDLANVAKDYFLAVDQRRFDDVAALLDAKIDFTTPDGLEVHGPANYVSALKRIAPIVRRNEVKRIFVDGNEVCIIYDLVTDTPIGAIPSVEWMTFHGGKITKIRLIFHSKPWVNVLQELAHRTETAH